MVETIRLFVGNLPSGVTENDLQDVFGAFGNVISTEVKQKKDLYENLQKKGFAFVTLESDSMKIDECIREFSNNKWKGEIVYVSRARESFLERLKKEREEARKAQEERAKSQPKPTETKSIQCEINKNKPVKIKHVKINQHGNSLKLKRLLSDDDETPVVKSKINENSPTATVKTIKPSYETEDVKNPKLVAAHAKRLQSMKEMRDTYKSKKSAIQQSLSNVDKIPNKKIKFGSDDEDAYNSNNLTKDNVPDNPLYVWPERTQKLFQNDDESGDEDYKFELKEQFEGANGQKLLELQSRYKSDTRFVLGERFMDKEEKLNGTVNNANVGLDTEYEKEKNLAMLQDILGVDVSRPKRIINNETSTRVKNMIRFDPTRPEHEKLILKKPVKPSDIQKKTKKERRKEREELRFLKEKERLEKKTEAVQVSQKTFYNVNVEFTKPTDEAAPFSLLSMFGKRDEDKKETAEGDGEEYSTQSHTKLDKKNRNPLDIDMKNPFKYDSSDSESEKDEREKEDTIKNSANKSVLPEGGIRFETFFFAKNDKRFKEGLEFFADTKIIHQKMRREMKTIVKKRLYNNERKNSKNLFKKKIGGKRQHYAKNTKPKRLK